MSLADLAKKAKNNRGGKGNAKPDTKVVRKPGITQDNYTFDYMVNSRNIEAFTIARRFLATDVGEKYGEPSTIIELGEHFQIFAPDEPDPGDLNDPDFGMMIGMQYKTEYASYIRTKAEYDSKCTQLWHFIYGKCTIAMKNALKQDANWIAIDRTKDALALWLAIVDISMNGTDEVDNDAKKMIEALHRFGRLHQKSQESVGDFLDRFNNYYDAMVAQGARLYNTVIPQGLAPNVEAQLQEENRVREEAMKSMSFLNKLDRTRYKGMMDALENASHFGRDEYPTTLTAAYAMACNYRENGLRVDGMMHMKEGHGVGFMTKTNSKSNTNEKNSISNDTKKACFICGDPAHFQHDCPMKEKVLKYYSKASKEVKDEVKKTIGLVSISSTIGEYALAEEGTRPFGKNDILLDNEASVSIFNNKKLLTNIRRTKSSMVVHGIGNGSITTNVVGDFLGIKGVYYHSDCVANLLCFYDVNQQFGVTFDNDEFNVIMKDININLTFKPKGKLYICEAKHEWFNKNVVSKPRHVSFGNVIVKTPDHVTSSIETLPKGDTLNNINVEHAFVNNDVNNISNIFSQNYVAPPPTLPHLYIEGSEKDLPISVYKHDIGPTSSQTVSNKDEKPESYSDSQIEKFSLENSAKIRPLSSPQNAEKKSEKPAAPNFTKVEISTLTNDDEPKKALLNTNDMLSMPREEKSEVSYGLVETVAENMSKYTKRDIEKADLAKKLYAIVGRPSLKDFINAVQNHRIKNCPINVEDIHRMTAIYGADIGAVLGRTVRKRPLSLQNTVVPRIDNEETVLFVDLFFINNLTFLLSISKGFNMLVVAYMDDKKKDSLEININKTIAQYAKFRVKVTSIICDGESAVAALKIPLEMQGISVDISSKNEHVSVIERAGRQLKERVRAFINTLPFNLTKEMLIYLVYYLTSMINSFPRSTSALEGVSPKEKLTGKVLDYNLDCQLEFGDYVQANEDDTRTNTMNARTFPAICLGPVGNIQASYYFMSLLTFEVVRRRSWVKMPLPNEVIDKINAKSSREEVTYQRGGLRFRLGETELMNDDDEHEEDVNQVESNIDEEVKNDEVEEINYEPDYFHEELPLPLDNNDDEVSEEVDQPYNLRQTPARLQWKEKYGSVYHTYNVLKGIKQYGEEAKESMKREMAQLLQKGVFHPVKYEELTPVQKVRILRSMMLLKRKRSGLLKSRFLVDGSGQIRALSAVNPSSPTVSIEALFVIAAITAMEKRHKVTVDVEGAYLHADMIGEVRLRVDPLIADILCEIDNTYEDYRRHDRSIIVMLDKALYGCIESAKLFYDNISNVLLNFGFKQNPYDSCVFNKIMYDHQCTVAIYVDDLKISCEDRRGVDDVLLELKRVYGTINVHEEDIVDYLGMDFDYSIPGIVKISMKSMIEQILEDFPTTDISRTPASAELFQVDESSPLLDDERKESFHSLVAKLLYMAKRARPDILTSVIFLTTRVLKSTEQDWNKLLKIIKYLNGTKDLTLHLSADCDITINSYIDASFANHPDGKSHTGEMITLGGGAIYSKSSKQKLVTRSSTEAELVGLSDGLPTVLWMKNFLEAQGYQANAIIHQDNKSTITLAEKGKSTTNRTRHVNIRYFFVKDKIDTKEVKVEYLPTEEMIADFFSKPLQGAQFEKFRDMILNIPKP